MDIPIWNDFIMKVTGVFCPAVPASIFIHSACMQNSAARSRNQVCAEDRLQGAQSLVYPPLQQSSRVAQGSCFFCQMWIRCLVRDISGVNVDLNPLEKVLSESSANQCLRCPNEVVAACRSLSCLMPFKRGSKETTFDHRKSHNPAVFTKRSIVLKRVRILKARVPLYVQC